MHRYEKQEDNEAADLGTTNLFSVNGLPEAKRLCESNVECFAIIATPSHVERGYGWFYGRAKGATKWLGYVRFVKSCAAVDACRSSIEVVTCACSYDADATVTYTYKLPAPQGCSYAYCGTSDELLRPPPSPLPPPLPPPPPPPPPPPSPPPPPPVVAYGEIDNGFGYTPQTAGCKAAALIVMAQTSACTYATDWALQQAAHAVVEQLPSGSLVSVRQCGSSGLQNMLGAAWRADMQGWSSDLQSIATALAARDFAGISAAYSAMVDYEACIRDAQNAGWPSSGAKWVLVLTDHMAASNVYPYTHQLDGSTVDSQETVSRELIAGTNGRAPVALSVAAIESSDKCYSPSGSLPIGEWATRMASEPKASMSALGSSASELVELMPRLVQARFDAEGCRDTSSSCRLSVLVKAAPFQSPSVGNYVTTTWQGQDVHEPCFPGGGYFTCARGARVVPDAGGSIKVQTTVSASVDDARRSFNGVLVPARYTLGCSATKEAAMMDEGRTADAIFTDVPSDLGECTLSVSVWKNDFASDDKYVAFTTANGIKLHGVCQTDQASAGGNAWYECASGLAVSPDGDGKLDVSSTVSEAVVTGSQAYMRYTLSCPTQTVPSAETALAFPDARTAAHTFQGLPPAAAGFVCALDVEVFATDMYEDDQYVVETTANGEQVHARCESGMLPLTRSNEYVCARNVLLADIANDQTYDFVTTAYTASGQVAELDLEVNYELDCAGICLENPPPPPTYPPPSLLS